MKVNIRKPLPIPKFLTDAGHPTVEGVLFLAEVCSATEVHFNPFVGEASIVVYETEVKGRPYIMDIVYQPMYGCWASRYPASVVPDDSGHEERVKRIHELTCILNGAYLKARLAELRDPSQNLRASLDEYERECLLAWGQYRHRYWGPDPE